MNIDLRQIPFSCRGSYLAVSQLPAGFRGWDNPEGLYLRSIHGLNYVPSQRPGIPAVARLAPLWAGQPLDFTVQAQPDCLTLFTERGRVQITFADPDTLLLRGEGVALRLEIDARLSPGTFIHPLPGPLEHGHLINAGILGRRFAIGTLAGALEVRTGWGGGDAAATFSGESWQGVLRDVAGPGELPALDFEACRRARAEEFAAFVQGLPAAPEAYAGARQVAAYVDWASLVQPQGLLKREAMFMSKNWMCNVWSWDHCFNAMALAQGHPDLAWDQFMLPFDFQDETGMLPDAVNDVYAVRNFVKPPIHGWALLKMMEHMTLTDDQARQAYDCLARWTRWWLCYRDHDSDGVCEYFHGNDSGWDNSTAFLHCPPVELPDLTAFLIVQTDALAALARQLGRPDRAAAWLVQGAGMLGALLEHSFPEGRPLALVSGTHERVDNDSLIAYLPLILGDRLPQPIRDGMIEQVRTRFLTEHGFATEAPDSPYYDPDGYWRGPIWAPSTMLLIDGLARCGETGLAREAAERFCRMVQRSGCAENFDALTGEGLRDRAYTWTSSVFLLLARDYLGG